MRFLLLSMNFGRQGFYDTTLMSEAVVVGVALCVYPGGAWALEGLVLVFLFSLFFEHFTPFHPPLLTFSMFPFFPCFPLLSFSLFPFFPFFPVFPFFLCSFFHSLPFFFHVSFIPFDTM